MKVFCCRQHTRVFPRVNAKRQGLVEGVERNKSVDGIKEKKTSFVDAFDPFDAFDYFRLTFANVI